MTDSIRCYSCHGRKTIIGNGYMPRVCPSCKGVGLVESIKEPVVVYKANKKPKKKVIDAVEIQEQ